MKGILLVACLAGACGDDRDPSDPIDSGQGPGLSITVSEVARNPSTIIRAQELDPGRIGIITDVPARTETTCPDCEALDIPDDECPAVCSRERLEWSVVDATGNVVLGPRVLRTFVHPWSSTYLGYVQSGRLGNGNIAVAWTLCEGPPARSCEAEYAVFSPDGDPVVPRRTLYQGLYGELTMVVDPVRDIVLIARSSELVVRAGVFAAVLAADGSILRDFERIGSSAARHAIGVVDDGGFTLITEDRQPLADDQACPACERLDTCLIDDDRCAFGNRIAPEAGLWATRITAAGPGERRRIATGWDGELYFPHNTYGAVVTTAGLAVASWWDVMDRSIAAYVAEGDGFRSSTLPLTSFGIEAPARWLGIATAPDGELAVFGEALATDAEGAQPHRFFSAGLSAEGLVAPTIIGEPFRGNGFGPTGDVASGGGLVAGGALDSAGTAYEHWRVFRFAPLPR